MSLEFYPTAQGAGVVMANPAPQSSVTLSQTAKGLTQVEVKTYAADPEEAAAKATELYDRLVARYARGEAQP